MPCRMVSVSVAFADASESSICNTPESCHVHGRKQLTRGGTPKIGTRLSKLGNKYRIESRTIPHTKTFALLTLDISRPPHLSHSLRYHRNPTCPQFFRQIGPRRGGDDVLLELLHTRRELLCRQQVQRYSCQWSESW